MFFLFLFAEAVLLRGLRVMRTTSGARWVSEEKTVDNCFFKRCRPKHERTEPRDAGERGRHVTATGLCSHLAFFTMCSNPTSATNKKGTFVYQRFLFLFIHCESNGISSPREVRCISSRAAKAPLYLITLQCASPLRLDDMQFLVELMIYKALP